MTLSLEVEIYQLRVYLREISPTIWRRLLLRSDSTIIGILQNRAKMNGIGE